MKAKAEKARQAAAIEQAAEEARQAAEKARQATAIEKERLRIAAAIDAERVSLVCPCLSLLVIGSNCLCTGPTNERPRSGSRQSSQVRDAGRLHGDR